MLLANSNPVARHKIQLQGDKVMHEIRNEAQAAPYVFKVDKLEPGDVLLSRIPMHLDNTSTWDSHLIQTLTRSRFSHAALHLGNGLFIAAVGTSVARLPIDRAGVGSAQNICLLRVRKQSDSQPIGIGRKAASFGQRYLQRGFCQARLPCAKSSAFHDVRRAAVVNSGLVASAYADAEFALCEKKNPYEIFPGDFLQSAQLEDVTAAVLKTASAPTETTFRLDDSSLFERVHHWEIATQLKILCNFDVRRILDIEARRPSSFRELELLIADKAWSALDEAVNRGLMWYRYADVFQQRLQRFLGGIELEANAVARLLPSLLSEAQLAAAALRIGSEIQQLESERAHWQQQWNFYTDLQNKYAAKTFSYLINLYVTLLETSARWLNAKQQQQRFCSEEAHRRGFRLKTA